jgi:hypothetical protein
MNPSINLLLFGIILIMCKTRRKCQDVCSMSAWVMNTDVIMLIFPLNFLASFIFQNFFDQIGLFNFNMARILPVDLQSNWCLLVRRS